MTITEYLTYQSNDAIKEFSNNMIQSLVAIQNVNIKKYAKKFNWEILNLEHTNPQKVILIKKEKNDIPELWVSADYTNYRRAFKLYLSKYFKINDLNRLYHVDHVVSRNTFKNINSFYYIRLFLISGELNCKYGALYEKLLSQHNNKKNELGDFHTSYLNLFKPLGLTLQI